MMIRSKNGIKIMVLFAVALLVVLAVSLSNSSDNTSKNKNIEYIDNHYAVIYTAAWKSLPKDQRIEKLELPADFLAGLTDNELVYAVIHYPFTIDMLVHEDLRVGYEYVLSYSGVLKEYERREGKQKMLNEYHSSELCTLEEKDNQIYQWVFDALLSLSTIEST